MEAYKSSRFQDYVDWLKKEDIMAVNKSYKCPKIKLCGLSSVSDIEAANALKPEFIGFVIWEKSKRNVSKDKAAKLKELLDPDIKAVGVFVDEDVEIVADLLNRNIIDIAQLHGNEDNRYIAALKEKTDKPLIKAFQVKSSDDIADIEKSDADFVLIDSGQGTGKAFDWKILEGVKRDFFLAGGLDPDNVAEAVRAVAPYAIDVSSGIETNGKKDRIKMERFVGNARN